MAQMLWCWWCLIFKKEGGGKKRTLLNHLSLEIYIYAEGFGKPATPTDNQVVALIMGAHYIISRWKQTHIPTHRQRSHAARALRLWQAIYTHSTHYHTHIHSNRDTTHTLSSEIWGPFWQPPSWLGIGQTGVIQEKQSGPTRGLGLLCLWSVTLHHEGNP